MFRTVAQPSTRCATRHPVIPLRNWIDFCHAAKLLLEHKSDVQLCNRHPITQPCKLSIRTEHIHAPLGIIG